MAYTRIAGPETLRFMPGDVPVLTPELYLGWHAAQLSRADVARQERRGDMLEARVEHGRWIVDCPVCSVAGARVGMLTRPDWGLACCAECGGVYRCLVFPADYEAIVRILLERPSRMTQNWRVPETAADLQRENVAHGIGEER